MYMNGELKIMHDLLCNTDCLIFSIHVYICMKQCIHSKLYLQADFVQFFYKCIILLIYYLPELSLFCHLSVSTHLFHGYGDVIDFYTAFGQLTSVLFWHLTFSYRQVFADITVRW